jgi:hypothetical protein
VDTLADSIRVVVLLEVVRTLRIEDRLTKAQKTHLVADLIRGHHLAHLQDIAVLGLMNLVLATTGHHLAQVVVVHLAVHPTHLLAHRAALHLLAEEDLFTEDNVK